MLRVLFAWVAVACVSLSSASGSALPMPRDTKDPSQYDEVEEQNKVLKEIQALPKLRNVRIVWDDFFREMQVIHTENTVSCIGFSVARAMRLQNIKKRDTFVPSPEFLYDVGTAYFALLSNGEIPFPIVPFSELKKAEARARLKLIETAYGEAGELAKRKKYNPSATILVLDYAKKFPLASRNDYSTHFAGWEGKRQEVKVEIVDYPPSADCLKGVAYGAYNNPRGMRLKAGSEFSDTSSYLANFDFRLIDEALARGYFPIVDINTSALNQLDDGFVEYGVGGGTGHSLVVVKRVEDKEDGDYYEILDSWVDEKKKERSKDFVSTTYAIRAKNLRDKMIHVTVLK